MKILFVSPDIEEKARGINFILKSLVKAAEAEGHEVGLLVGYPDGQAFEKSAQINNKVEHIYLQHYLREGRSSFRYIIPGGYSRRNIAKTILRTDFFKTKEVKVNTDYLSGSSGLEKQLNFFIRSPFFYQFLVRNYVRTSRMLIKRLVKKHKIDLVICASPTVIRSSDVGSAKLAHFVHDVMPFELIEAPPDNDTPNRYAHQFYSSVTNSDLLMANSEDTAGKIKEVNPEANVHVLYGTASSPPKDVPQTSILQNMDLRSKRYLLFTSTLEKRKNIENLLDGYSMIASKINMPLVLVGGPGYGFEDIEAKFRSLSPEVRNNVRFTGYVSEADKYTLFKNAMMFVFPSVYEGIGLVIFEAMLNDLPVITSNRGALPEAGGDAAFYVEDPYNPKEIADAIVKVANDAKLREDMVAKGHKVVSKFTLEKFEARFNKALESIGK